jgi:translation elongation factor EF-1alpha
MDYGEHIGKVKHYFDKIGVAVILIEHGHLKIGDTIRIKGANDDFEMDITSMQVKHTQVTEAKTGDDIGMKVTSPVHENDKVYKV